MKVWLCCIVKWNRWHTIPLCLTNLKINVLLHAGGKAWLIYLLSPVSLINTLIITVKFNLPEIWIPAGPLTKDSRTTEILDPNLLFIRYKRYCILDSCLLLNVYPKFQIADFPECSLALSMTQQVLIVPELKKPSI